MRNIISLFVILLFVSVTSAMVNNNVLFVGEKIFGGSPGAPLVIGATSSDLTSGQIGTTKISTTGAITTTSATDVVMAGITLTPLAGTYQVRFTTSFTHSANNANIFFSIYAGGAQDAASEMEVRPTIQGGVTPTLALVLSGSTLAEVTVNGSQAIEVRWRTSASTATSTNRYMIITRIR